MGVFNFSNCQNLDACCCISFLHFTTLIWRDFCFFAIVFPVQFLNPSTCYFLSIVLPYNSTILCRTLWDFMKTSSTFLLRGISFVTLGTPVPGTLCALCVLSTYGVTLLASKIITFYPEVVAQTWLDPLWGFWGCWATFIKNFFQ